MAAADWITPFCSPVSRLSETSALVALATHEAYWPWFFHAIVVPRGPAHGHCWATEQPLLGATKVPLGVEAHRSLVSKIGMTRRLDPLDRVRELGDASVPFGFDVRTLLKCDDPPAREREPHKRFLTAQVNKFNPRKEFFRVPLSELRAAVCDVGVVARWTQTAEAREYRETLAIEQALRADPAQAKQWLQEQESFEPAEGLDEDGAKP